MSMAWVTPKEASQPAPLNQMSIRHTADHMVLASVQMSTYERRWLCEGVVKAKTAHLYRQAGLGPPEGARSGTPLPDTPEKPQF